MASYKWSIPSGKEITGSTYLKDTDNYLGDTINDLVDFVNGEGLHENQGLAYDFVDRISDQTINGVMTFTQDIVADVTGNASGNSGTATKLATARTITLAGDVTGSVSFDGSANASITTTVIDDSHNHTIAYVTGLQTALDGKLSTSGNAATSTLATKSSALASGGGNGTAMTFTWSGQSGQPSWLWGGNDGANMYIYNPSNFNVNYASSAGYANSAGSVDSVSSSVVGVATTGLVAGSIGSYAMLSVSGVGTMNIGSTVAGSNLTPAGIYVSSGGVSRQGVVQNITMSGTWRCMGYSYTAYEYAQISLWLRIA